MWIRNFMQGFHLQCFIADQSVIRIIACTVLLACMPTYAATPWLHADGNQLKDPDGNVVILRGVDLIDLGHLEDWQGGAINMINRLTDKTDTQCTSAGWYPKVLRIDIHPADSVNNWPHRFEHVNDDFYNNLLRPVVDHCASKDLYVIIDWHYVANTYDHVETTSEFWEYMAPKFANDSHVIFELFNEPINDLNGDWIFNSNDVNDWISVRDDMQTWIDIVRNHAPNNLILVGGPFYCQVLAPAVDYPVSDPVGNNNIAYVSHMYPGHWLDSNNSSSYQNQITTCHDVYPVFMSEWGFSESSSSENLRGTISNYGQPIMDFVEGLGISNSAWVASYNWEPPMFNSNWTLRSGEGEMGCFVKDTLYARRNDDQPGEPGSSPPVCSITWPINNIRIRENVDLTIYAEASDTDGTVTKVEFFEGTNKLGEDTSDPYEYTWIGIPEGNYDLTARATDNDSLEGTSPASSLVVGGTTGSQTTRYEAEDAAYTGSITRKTDGQASEGRYLDMRDDGTITWTVSVANAGTYDMTIGFKVAYGSPKSQYLSVNGGTQTTITFSGDTDTWLETTELVSLNAGDNTIEIEGFWSWMYFDYIEFDMPVLCAYGDLDLDCDVDIDDLVIMATGWLNPYEMTDTADVAAGWLQ